VKDSETVWLIGMMGVGKSTVGRALARRLGRRFVDSDTEIERQTGQSIGDLFASDGEPTFRERELSVIEGLGASGAVVALGGGAIAQPAVREALAGRGPIVYLRATPETLLNRLGTGAGRPLLSGLGSEDRLERLTSLLKQRESSYATAILSVDTDEMELAGVVDWIIGALQIGDARS